MFLKPYATQRNGLCLDTSVSQATYVPKKHFQNKINIYVIKLEWYFVDTVSCVQYGFTKEKPEADQSES